MLFEAVALLAFACVAFPERAEGILFEARMLTPFAVAVMSETKNTENICIQSRAPLRQYPLSPPMTFGQCLGT